jgi:hypothetical protein
VGTRLVALFFAASLLFGCQTFHIGSSSCVGLDDRDCDSAEATAKLAAPVGRGPIARIDIERNWEGCFLVLCDRLRATVRIAYLNSDEIVTVHVEREHPLAGMQATHVEVGRSTR